MKEIYKTYIVLDPKDRGIVSESQIRTMHVYHDRIRIGKDETELAQMVSRRIQDGCIHYWNGKDNIRLGVQGFQSKGRNDPALTEWMNQLLDLLAKGKREEADGLIAHLKYISRMIHIRHAIHVVVMIAFVAAIVAAFTLIPALPRLTEDHPVVTIASLLISVVILSNLTANVLIRRIAERLNRRTTASSLSGDPAAGSPPG